MVSSGVHVLLHRVGDLEAQKVSDKHAVGWVAINKTTSTQQQQKIRSHYSISKLNVTAYVVVKWSVMVSYKQSDQEGDQKRQSLGTKKKREEEEEEEEEEEAAEGEQIKKKKKKKKEEKKVGEGQEREAQEEEVEKGKKP